MFFAPVPPFGPTCTSRGSDTWIFPGRRHAVFQPGFLLQCPFQRFPFHGFVSRFYLLLSTVESETFPRTQPPHPKPLLERPRPFLRGSQPNVSRYEPLSGAFLAEDEVRSDPGPIRPEGIEISFPFHRHLSLEISMANGRCTTLVGCRSHRSSGHDRAKQLRSTTMAASKCDVRANERRKKRHEANTKGS